MKVTQCENRGSFDVPFGFVYFDDNTRVGFSRDEGVWPANWGGNTARHLSLAAEALRAWQDEGGIAAEVI